MAARGSDGATRFVVSDYRTKLVGKVNNLTTARASQILGRAPPRCLAGFLPAIFCRDVRGHSIRARATESVTLVAQAERPRRVRFLARRRSSRRADVLFFSNETKRCRVLDRRVPRADRPRPRPCPRPRPAQRVPVPARALRGDEPPRGGRLHGGDGRGLPRDGRGRLARGGRRWRRRRNRSSSCRSLKRRASIHWSPYDPVRVVNVIP